MVEFRNVMDTRQVSKIGKKDFAEVKKREKLRKFKQRKSKEKRERMSFQDKNPTDFALVFL